LIRSFCNFLKDEADELIKTTPTGANPQLAAAVYNEVLPVLSWCCSKLVEPTTGSPNNNNNSPFIMECILTLSSALPSEVNTNPHFTAFLWKIFVPALVQSIGTPGRFTIEKKFGYKDAINLIENENRGFFTKRGLRNTQSVRCIYLVAVQLLRISGSQASLRPMLEALFHRILIFQNVASRSEPLKIVREMFK
jgi:brefeldin A-inhibited guanine nucleotide-exchange protein 3